MSITSKKNTFHLLAAGFSNAKSISSSILSHPARNNSNILVLLFKDSISSQLNALINIHSKHLYTLFFDPELCAFSTLFRKYGLATTWSRITTTWLMGGRTLTSSWMHVYDIVRTCSNIDFGNWPSNSGSANFEILKFMSFFLWRTYIYMNQKNDTVIQ